MAIFPTYQQACFALDPAAGLNAANQWKDSGPYQLDCSPQGYAAPAYGISNGPSGAPKINFDGATQRGQMAADVMARFYTIAPTTALTFAVVARYNAPAASDRIFNCRNGAATRGIQLMCTTANRLIVEAYDAAGVGALTFDTADVPLAQRTRVSIMAVGGSSTTLRYGWHDRVGWAQTAFNTTGAWTYDTAVVPYIGEATGGGGRFDGDLYFLGLWPFVWTDSEAKAFSDYWIDRT